MSTPTIRVKPVDPNEVILDPQTMQRLPPEGADKPDTTYWRRRIRDKSVELVESAVSTNAAPIGNEPVLPLTTRGSK